MPQGNNDEMEPPMTNKTVKELVERWRAFVDAPEELGASLDYEDACALLTTLTQQAAEIEALRERVVELWHDSNADHGTLYECLGMTWDQYAKWANPTALTGGGPTDG